MEIILWIIAFPILVLCFFRMYEMIVADFSPDKKRRKQAKKFEENYAIATDKYISWLFRFIWKVTKWVVPAIIIIVIIIGLMDYL